MCKLWTRKGPMKKVKNNREIGDEKIVVFMGKGGRNLLVFP